MIDWDRPADEIDRLIRGCAPAPGAWTTFRGERFKINSARIARERPAARVRWRSPRRRSRSAPRPGALELGQVQAQGKKPMPAADWARGVTCVRRAPRCLSRPPSGSGASPAPTGPGGLAFDALRAVNSEGAYANLVLPALLGRAADQRRGTPRSPPSCWPAPAGGQGTYDLIIAAAAGRELKTRCSRPCWTCSGWAPTSCWPCGCRPRGRRRRPSTWPRPPWASGSPGWSTRCCGGSPRTTTTAGWTELDRGSRSIMTGSPCGPRIRGGSSTRTPTCCRPTSSSRRCAADNVSPPLTLAVRPGLAEVAELLGAGRRARAAGRRSPPGWSGNPADLPAVRAGPGRGAGRGLPAGRLGAGPADAPAGAVARSLRRARRQDRPAGRAGPSRRAAGCSRPSSPRTGPCWSAGRPGVPASRTDRDRRRRHPTRLAAGIVHPGAGRRALHRPRCAAPAAGVAVAAAAGRRRAACSRCSWRC